MTGDNVILSFGRLASPVKRKSSPVRVPFRSVEAVHLIVGRVSATLRLEVPGSPKRKPSEDPLVLKFPATKRKDADVFVGELRQRIAGKGAVPIELKVAPTLREERQQRTAAQKEENLRQKAESERQEALRVAERNAKAEEENLWHQAERERQKARAEEEKLLGEAEREQEALRVAERNAKAEEENLWHQAERERQEKASSTDSKSWYQDEPSTCALCGEDVPDYAPFCPWCGESLTDSTRASEPEEATEKQIAEGARLLDVAHEEQQRRLAPEVARMQQKVDEEVARDSKKRARRGMGCLFVVLLALGGCVTLVVTGQDDNSAQEKRFGAIQVCENFVKKRLRSPGTADFQRPDDSRVSQVGADYTYRAYVDSQNGFGALLRANFVCTVRDAGGTTFQLVSLELD